MKYAEDTIPVCAACALIEDSLSVTKMCDKCGVVYCQHYASDVDVRYCANCMSDFKVVETIETKIVEHMNEDNEVTSRRKYTCKSLNLSGTDWLFTSRKINTLTEEELTASIEYHREIASMMLQEREARRVEHFHKLAQVKLNFGPRPEHDATGAIKKSKDKKNRTTSSKKKPDANAIASAFATLLGATLTPEQVQEALRKLGENK